MSLRSKGAVKSMEYKSEYMNIKRKRTGKKIEPMGIEHMRIEPTRLKHMRMQHIMIRSKVVCKQTKPKRLCGRIKHIRKGKIVVHMRMT